MHDYYRIRPVAETSDLGGRSLDRETLSTVVPREPSTGTRVVVDEATVDGRCFADDIVVDFPSVQKAVGRILASFLGS